MSYWSDSTLLAALQEAEAQIVQDVPTLVERYAPNIYTGVGTYQLPNYVMTIRKVMWKGFQLDPAKFAHVISSDSSPINNVSGRPREYVIDGYGSNVLKLFPNPNETLAGTDVDLWGANIPEKCIVEYYRAVDTTSTTLRLPATIRDILTFPYALSKLFAREGIYQDMQAAEYYQKQYQQMLELYKETIRELWAAWPKILTNEPSRPGKLRMPHPTLPAKFYDVS